MAYAKCDACIDQRYSEPEYINIEKDLCYNIDNYTNSLQQFLEDDKSPFKILPFDGSSGNISEFSNSKNANYLALSGGGINIANTGYLKSLYIAGEEINAEYFQKIDEYYNQNDGYYKIKLGGNINYFNGAKMEVNLCTDSGSSDNWNYNCSTISKDASNKKIVIANPTLVENSEYDFNNIGYIYKTNSDVMQEYYTHENDDEGNKLRLNFKIIDNAPTNCKANNTGDGFESCTHNDVYLDESCDMVKLNNTYYDSNDPSNVNGICNLEGAINLTKHSPDSDGNTICKKQYYCDNRYADNSGEYNIRIQVPKSETSFIRIPAKNYRSNDCYIGWRW